MYDVVFGAENHDPTLWHAHPLVLTTDIQFDGKYGFVGLMLSEEGRGAGLESCDEAEISVTPDRPHDLYFWGEFDCPVAIFQRFPRMKAFDLALLDPTESYPSRGWAVKLWLSERLAS